MKQSDFTEKAFAVVDRITQIDELERLLGMMNDYTYDKEQELNRIKSYRVRLMVRLQELKAPCCKPTPNTNPTEEK